MIQFISNYMLGKSHKFGNTNDYLNIFKPKKYQFK